MASRFSRRTMSTGSYVLPFSAFRVQTRVSAPLVIASRPSALCMAAPRSPTSCHVAAEAEKDSKDVTKPAGGRQKSKEKVENCLHPAACIVEGANQYGRWQRCLQCQTKISYTPHQYRQEKKKKDKQVAVVYVTKEVPKELEEGAPKAGHHKKEKEEASSSTDVKALQETLIESNQQLLTGMTSLLGQAMTPIVQGQQALMEMSQQAMMGQGAMMQAVQSSQAELTQAVLHLMKTPREAPEQEWDKVDEEAQHR